METFDPSGNPGSESAENSSSTLRAPPSLIEAGQMASNCSWKASNRRHTDGEKWPAGCWSLGRMTFKLEQSSDGERWIVRLIGFVQSEHLEEISRQLHHCGPDAALDLDGVTVVGVEVIRFLLGRERQGTELLGCPAYIREWISREGGQSR